MVPVSPAGTRGRHPTEEAGHWHNPDPWTRLTVLGHHCSVGCAPQRQRQRLLRGVCADWRALDSERHYYFETFVTRWLKKALSAIDGQTKPHSDHYVAGRRGRTRPLRRTESEAFVHAEVSSSKFYGVLCSDVGLTKVLCNQGDAFHDYFPWLNDQGNTFIIDTFHDSRMGK